MGEVAIEKTRGFISVISNQANIKINGGSGTLQFEIVRGSLLANQFQGRTEGHSQEANVGLQLSTEQDVNLKSQSGRMTVAMPKDSGAMLNLNSVEGEIIVPSYLRVAKEGSSKSLKGRLKGEGKESLIIIRSQEGAIIVK
jgi:DUF4097 and DUF4098 domain-containing protein YvlB